MSIRPAVAALTGLFFLIAPVAPAAALEAASVAQAAIAPTHLSIPAPDGRAVLLDVWAAPDERGVVVFSHGFGGAPEAYGRLLTAWARHGFTVIAPLHVDSQKHPNRDATGQVAFLTRLEDLSVARAEAARTHPGKPLIAAGHSFGSLMSLIEGGAVTVAGSMGDPAVKGVIAFSSAGNIPNVVTPETYSTLAGPLLVITGDRDLVPGFADDWRDHRIPFDVSPAGDKTLLIFAGADHQLPGTADGARFDQIVQATEDFLDAYALNDASARARLQAFAADGVTVERR